MVAESRHGKEVCLQISYSKRVYSRLNTDDDWSVASGLRACLCSCWVTLNIKKLCLVTVVNEKINRSDTADEYEVSYSADDDWSVASAPLQIMSSRT